MKLQVQTALAALVLGMCSTVVLADGEEAARPGGGGGNPMPDGCAELCKEASIPIQLKVNKLCHLEVGPSIVLNGATGAGSGSFKVGANADFTILVDTDNQVAGVNKSQVKNGAASINTSVTTTGADNLTLGVPKSKSATMANFLSYNVNVQATEAWGINKPAGTYTDTYRIKVFF